MYSLFVSHLAEDPTRQTFDLPRDRFLEYTSESITQRLKSLSAEAIDSIKSWPCIVMQEGRGEEEARVGVIVAIEESSGRISITFQPIECDPPLLNDALWKMRAELDIEQFEFSRNHWAVKDCDPIPAIRARGHAFKGSTLQALDSKPLPTFPPRSDLISAGRIMAEWGHTEIDDFLLEAGVTGLRAGRDIGGRKDRANAIVQFAIDHPTAKTAENSLFSWLVVRRAASRALSEGIQGASGPKAQAVATRSPDRVFVVHGQNAEARDATVSFLKEVGLKAIVLHDQPNMGRHLLTKFIDEAELVTFAIILMTDDDFGGLKGAPLAPRARQNVILELGYFIAHLGQERVCALITPGLETPSDFDGIVYIKMDQGERWKVELQRELAAAGMPINGSAI